MGDSEISHFSYPCFFLLCSSSRETKRHKKAKDYPQSKVLLRNPEISSKPWHPSSERLSVNGVLCFSSHGPREIAFFYSWPLLPSSVRQGENELRNWLPSLEEGERQQHKRHKGWKWKSKVTTIKEMDRSRPLYAEIGRGGRRTGECSRSHWLFVMKERESGQGDNVFKLVFIPARNNNKSVILYHCVLNCLVGID